MHASLIDILLGFPNALSYASVCQDWHRELSCPAFVARWKERHDIVILPNFYGKLKPRLPLQSPRPSLNHLILGNELGLAMSVVPLQGFLITNSQPSFIPTSIRSGISFAKVQQKHDYLVVNYEKRELRDEFYFDQHRIVWHHRIGGKLVMIKVLNGKSCFASGDLIKEQFGMERVWWKEGSKAPKKTRGPFKAVIPAEILRRQQFLIAFNLFVQSKP